jgi:hypothetical protein
MLTFLLEKLSSFPSCLAGIRLFKYCTMVALLEEYNPRPAKTDLSPKKCSTANLLETSNRVGKLLSAAQGLRLEKEVVAYETASGHLDGPFGELVSQTGSYSTTNTYKLSTKPQDAETGYYYYWL